MSKRGRSHLVPLDLAMTAAALAVVGAGTTIMRLVGRPSPEFVWREIHWPDELEPEAALGFLRQIATDRMIELIVFEIEGSGGDLVYRIGVPKPAIGRVEQLLAALLPEVVLAAAPERRQFEHAWHVELTSRHRPLQIAEPERVTRALLAGVTAAGKSERVCVQWLLGRTRAPRPVAAAESSVSFEPWWRPLLQGESKLDTEARRALQTKRGEHTFACSGRVAIEASKGRARGLAVGVLAGLRLAEGPGVGLKLIRESASCISEASVPRRWPLRLNVLELVGLLGWPLGDSPLPGLPRDQSRLLRADTRLRAHGRVLAESSTPGDSRLLGLSADDARHHLHVIGPTGTGKSTLLANLIVQDIAAGRGVVLIEPKGDLVADVLARVPESRRADVVVLDPAEGEFPVGLNPLLGRGRRPELVADQVLAVFHGLWKNNWGPRMQDILHSALLTLASQRQASLCLLPALLTNEAVRRRLRISVDDPIGLEPFWAWYESISDAERQQAIAPVLNKLRPFLLRRSVRAIVGQVQPRFRIDEVFTQRKVVLVSLAKGLLGPEASALLGSLFVAELWHAILGRAAVAPEKRHSAMVYLDEFGDYVHLPTDMADALAQARGLGVGLTLAHQHLGQLPGNLRAAVLANARSRVCFQLSGEDAQAMVKLSSDKLKASDFQRLRRFQVYLHLIAGGEQTGWASGRTLPLAAVSSDPEAIRTLSRTRYGRPVAEVEAEISRLLGAGSDADERLWTRGRGRS
jgi:hypothetical protein